jgi:hypothetical protein
MMFEWRVRRAGPTRTVESAFFEMVESSQSLDLIQNDVMRPRPHILHRKSRELIPAPHYRELKYAALTREMAIFLAILSSHVNVQPAGLSAVARPTFGCDREDDD